jgi:hypothetical protein
MVRALTGATPTRNNHLYPHLQLGGWFSILVTTYILKTKDHLWIGFFLLSMVKFEQFPTWYDPGYAQTIDTTNAGYHSTFISRENDVHVFVTGSTDVAAGEAICFHEDLPRCWIGRYVVAVERYCAYDTRLG